VQIEDFSFGRITFDKVTCEHDVGIDHGKVRKPNKKPSKKFRNADGYTPVGGRAINIEVLSACNRDECSRQCSGRGRDHAGTCPRRA
jgi:hypothetical protein